LVTQAKYEENWCQSVPSSFLRSTLKAGNEQEERVWLPSSYMQRVVNVTGISYRPGQ